MDEQSGKLTIHNFIRRRCKAIITSITMPQLLPFYFINQLSFSFLVLITMVYVFGTYILPVFAELFVTRMYITKL
jgi:F-type H+-transporting ATPase subunit 8